jgi:hypothetical protein
LLSFGTQTSKDSHSLNGIQLNIYFDSWPTDFKNQHSPGVFCVNCFNCHDRFLVSSDKTIPMLYFLTRTFPSIASSRVNFRNVCSFMPSLKFPDILSLDRQWLHKLCICQSSVVGFSIQTWFENRISRHLNCDVMLTSGMFWVGHTDQIDTWHDMVSTLL